jgi:hypothetical protein
MSSQQCDAISNIGDVKLVGASAPTGVYFGGNRVDAVAVDIERPQQIDRVGPAGSVESV